MPQVALAPSPRLQFLDVNGKPLAGGLVFTYVAGTTTPQASYTDSSGTILNSNPIVLDAGGFATIWLAALSYKIVVQNSLSVQQWMVDSVTLPGLSLLSTANLWTAIQTFGAGDMALLPGPATFSSLATAPRTISIPDNSGTIAENNVDNQFTVAQSILATANQLNVGSSANPTTLNFPAPAISAILTFPKVTDTILSSISPQMTNPTVNGVLFSNLGPPATGNVLVAQSPTVAAWGTGATTVLKKGTGSGTYSTSSLIYVPVDPGNLSYTVVIPIGSKLLIWATGSCTSVLSPAAGAIELADGGVQLINMGVQPAVSNAVFPFSLNWMIVGDGLSHTIDLRFLTTNSSGADAMKMFNDSINGFPTMLFLLQASS